MSNKNGTKIYLLEVWRKKDYGDFNVIKLFSFFGSDI